jgi:outer membrane receptor protein involved in Fe transport
MGLKIGQTQNLSLGYNMRIWRPSIYFLNPYVDDSNPSAISYGNSELKSEKSHAFNLSYSNFTAKLSVNLSLRHSFNNNSIENYSFIKDGILNSTYANIGKSRTTGMSAYINWNASPKTRIYVNASGNYSDYRSPSQNLKNNGWYALHTEARSTLFHSISFKSELMGSTPYISIQGRGSSYYDYGLSLNRSFIDKR